MRYEIEKWFQFINWPHSDINMQKALHFFSKEREAVRAQFDKLSWYADKAEQTFAIQYLSDNLMPDEYVYLIMPSQLSLLPYNNNKKYFFPQGGKERWENAAKTVVKIGWPKVGNIIIPLFVWLIDPNWPGSNIIYNFLLALPKNILKSKMIEILNNSNRYDNLLYGDLLLQIHDLSEDAKIIL